MSDRATMQPRALAAGSRMPANAVESDALDPTRAEPAGLPFSARVTRRLPAVGLPAPTVLPVLIGGSFRVETPFDGPTLLDEPHLQGAADATEETP